MLLRCCHGTSRASLLYAFFSAKGLKMYVTTGGVSNVRKKPILFSIHIIIDKKETTTFKDYP